MEFFRFPHTPHLAWLGTGKPRDDKVLAPREVGELLAHDLVVEEKVDGANIGLSADELGQVRAQNRGSYLDRGHCHPQFKPLWRWLEERNEVLVRTLGADLMLFGEWCYAVHSVRYTRLPDWFLVFDVYDRAHERFWSSSRRDELVRRLNLHLVPRLAAGRFELDALKRFMESSPLSEGPSEGLYVRCDEGMWLAARGKIVRPAFVQDIDEHWTRQPLRANALRTA